MADLDKWLKLFNSDKQAVKLRAAKALLEHDDTPVATLLEILDSIYVDHFTEVMTNRLVAAPNDEIVDAMIRRVDANEPLVRLVACTVLGQIGDSNAIGPMLSKIDDPHEQVRQAACHAIRQLGDTPAIPVHVIRPVASDPVDPLIRLFPTPESVFSNQIEMHSRYLLPLASVDLSRLDDSLSSLVHFISPIEPYDGVIGERNREFHNYLCRENYVGYRYNGDRCEIATDFRFFDLPNFDSGADLEQEEQHELNTLRDHYRDVRERYEQKRGWYEASGMRHFFDEDQNRMPIALGGPSTGGNWAEMNNFPLRGGTALGYPDPFGEEGPCPLELPLTRDGRAFIFIGQLAVSDYLAEGSSGLGCDMLLFYDPANREVLTTFDWT